MSAAFRPTSFTSAPACKPPASAERHQAQNRADCGLARSRPDEWRRPSGCWRRARSLPRPQPRRDPAARRSGAQWRVVAASDVEPRQTSADRTVGIDASENDIGIRQGRSVVTLAVTHRARHGAGRFRSDLQQAAAIDRRDRAAAGADGRDLDHRRANDQSEIDRGLRGQRRLAVRNQRYVKTGAADVAGDDVRKACRCRDVRSSDDAGGGS